MTKQIINIVEIPILHEMLEEIKSLLSFESVNFQSTKEFLNSDNFNIITVSHKNNKRLLSSTIVDIKNIILIDDIPVKLEQLLDTINIRLIKENYNLQSELNIKNYSLNLNSRVISFQNVNLKLTEREIDLILFLNGKKTPQTVNSLQNNVWKYTNTLETHTVETHIYRLRKKIKNAFDDDKFIISHEEGYLI
tara:strand:- start:30 stop:608 length:579 start_codon:yes stop_codon:yes gene_type:complete